MAARSQILFLGKESPVTWDSANKGSSVALSNGDLDATGVNQQCVRANKGVLASAGAYYEILVVTAFTNGGRAGAMNHSTFSNYMILTSQSGGVRRETTSFITTGLTAGAVTDVGGASANGDRWMFAIKGGSLWMGLNGTWLNSGNPSAGTTPSYTDLTGTHYPGADFVETTQKWRVCANTWNIVYTPPTGCPILGLT